MVGRNLAYFGPIRGRKQNTCLGRADRRAQRPPSDGKEKAQDSRPESGLRYLLRVVSQWVIPHETPGIMPCPFKPLALRARTKINVKDELIGKAIKCPKCGERIAVSANGSTVAKASRPDDPLGTTDHTPSAATPDPNGTVAQPHLPPMVARPLICRARTPSRRTRHRPAASPRSRLPGAARDRAPRHGLRPRRLRPRPGSRRGVEDPAARSQRGVQERLQTAEREILSDLPQGDIPKPPSSCCRLSTRNCTN